MSYSKTVLVVDDEPMIRTVLGSALKSEGFCVMEAAARQEALKAIGATKVDLVTLDLKLGDTNGLELAKEIRAIRNVPLVMITGKDSQFDKIVGLEHGADDYIVKPFNLRETMLQIHGVLRRYEAPLVSSNGNGQASDSPIRTFNHCVLDLAKRELRSSSGDLIDLTDAEFRLLALFVKNPARVLSRDEIARAVQGRDWSPLDRTVDGHVARLRRKLEGSTDEPCIIKSVRTVGYVFAAEVSAR